MRSASPTLLIGVALFTGLACAPSLTATDQKSPTLYYVVGFLEEYLGRPLNAKPPDLVERLYCNEHDKLPAFRAQLVVLAGQQGLPSEITETRVQDCLVLLRSQPLSHAINRFYGRVPRDRRLRISLDHFADATDDEKEAYLAGAYCRFGRDDTFVFANAAHKAHVVASLLTQLGFAGVSTDSVTNTVPNSQIVHFRRPPTLPAFWLAPCRRPAAR